jgi:hypothetical protein
MVAEPDLVGVCRSLNAAGAAYLVIGGFAVIAHQHIRATEDSDLLVPADGRNVEPLASGLAGLDAVVAATGAPPTREQLAELAHLRLATSAGLVDLVREGDPPLDFRSGFADRMTVVLDDVEIPVAGLALLVTLKRLAGRLRDRADLEELERVHGELPSLRLPDQGPPA